MVIEDNILDCDPSFCPYWAYGGGIYSGGGTLEMLDSTIQNNSSPDSSAIHNGSTTLRITNSTIRNNYASRAATIYNDSTVYVVNSTIAGNTSQGGAGILTYGDVLITSSTIANSGIAASIDHRYGYVIIKDSILYAVPNQAGTSYNCFIYPDTLIWYSFGHNIISDDTCPVTETGDLINTDPLLGEMDWWGGPTMTLPLLYGSPAINHRSDICQDVAGTPLTVDQRYFPRADGHCDTGAFEGFIYPVKVFLPLINR